MCPAPLSLLPAPFYTSPRPAPSRSRCHLRIVTPPHPASLHVDDRLAPPALSFSAQEANNLADYGGATTSDGVLAAINAESGSSMASMDFSWDPQVPPTAVTPSSSRSADADANFTFGLNYGLATGIGVLCALCFIAIVVHSRSKEASAKAQLPQPTRRLPARALLVASAFALIAAQPSTQGLVHHFTFDAVSTTWWVGDTR